ncbi:MAG: XRE family transcriptional regulator, partial [Lachnospiraceae bacterium]|nr:XRE family transcriptional regulator [Lachnospiraceae bacterium]
DELIEFDIDVKEIQEVIDSTSEEVSEKIDWTKAWSKKYPVLASYQNEVKTEEYAAELDRLLRDLEKKYGYDELNAFLVLKDILAVVWKSRKEQK